MLFNIPNILTVSRIVAIPIIIGFLYMGGEWGNWLAFTAYTYACITDFFDGYLARAWHQQSAFGRFLDPIADKLLVAGVLLMLLGTQTITSIHVLAASIILCREILVSGLREFLAQAQISMPVSLLAKWKTTIQMLALGFLIVGVVGPDFGPYGPIGPVSTLEIGIYGLWAAALITLITGYDYLRSGLAHIAQSDKDYSEG
ncbi:MAG: CDP-diacylglycerol--glycerol-3-phosphate 3-phosphatidyltransferase [Rhodospirillaceae bacterium]|nr:MAG: CDP-diacylglycerol--glycerol-3-phosphate 3-phosphatidyltransferase [Rhodospirillaceae bacterium]